MTKPTKKEIARARAMLRDPGYQYALRMHTFLAHCYRGQSKEFRYEMYEQAGIGQAITGAEKRAERLLKKQRHPRNA